MIVESTDLTRLRKPLLGSNRGWTTIFKTIVCMGALRRMMYRRSLLMSSIGNNGGRVVRVLQENLMSHKSTRENESSDSSAEKVAMP